MGDLVTTRVADGVALITIDDGKANAVSHTIIDQLEAALDQAEADARALVLAGREGKFSAGFDLAVMTASDESMRSLVTRGARMMMRLYGLGMPTVAACTGHALAAGSLLLLASDRRIGAAGSAKIGLNEVAIGMSLPIFAVEMARERITKAQFPSATMGAQIYDPASAALAGFLDQVVEPELVVETALAEAQRLSALRTGAYARTKLVARRSVIEHILATLDDDMAEVSAPTP